MVALEILGLVGEAVLAPPDDVAHLVPVLVSEVRVSTKRGVQLGV